MDEIQAFFDEILRLVRAGKKAAAIDLVYESIDDLLADGDLERTRKVLEVATLKSKEPDFPLSIFLSLLTVTRPYREQLNGARTALADSMDERMKREMGAPETEEVAFNLVRAKPREEAPKSSSRPPLSAAANRRIDDWLDGRSPSIPRDN